MKYNVKHTESCPNCENSLEEHSNGELQSCALSELSKLDKKNITLETDSTLKSSSENPTGGFVLD